MTNIEGLRHVFPEEKLAIFVTPKCGSSSLAKWVIFQRDYQALYEAGQSPEGRDVHTLTNMLACRTEDRLAREDFARALAAGDLQDWRTVKFVRNPYKRAVSSFLQILTLMNNSISLSFREFVNLPRYYFSNAGVPHMNTGEPHARLQATSAEVEGKLRMSHVYALEQGLTSGLRDLEALCAFDDSSRWTFRENRLTSKNPQLELAETSSAADMVFSGQDLASGAAVPPLESFLEDDIKKLIYDRYCEDFDVYGFDVDTGELPNGAPDSEIAATSAQVLSQSRMEAFLHQKNWELDYVYQPLPTNSYDPSALQQALTHHRELMARCQSIISTIGDNEKIVLYGAGEVLVDLILSTDIKDKKIVGVTASNIASMPFLPMITDNLGWSIVPPEFLQERLNMLKYDRIVIASFASAGEIRTNLAGRLYRIPDDKIVTLGQ